jgi:Zn-dependent protease
MDPHSIERPDESATTFRLGSVPVALSPSFFVLTVMFGLSRGLAGMASWVLVCFVSVLAHELGHAFMIRRFGGEPAILLYGGGGLTFGNTRETPGQAILVSLAGPATGFMLAGIAHAVWRTVPPSPGLDALYDDIFWVNVVWGAANLLPMLPLDGGNAFEALLSLRWPRRARLVAEVVTALCCAGVVGVALSMHWAWPALVAVYWTAPTLRSLYSRFERQRDREVVMRIEEVTSQRRGGHTGQAVAMAEQLLARARTRTYRRAVAEELALLCFDRGDVARATALIAEHFAGVEVPEALWLARALVDHGAAHEVDRLERESLASDSPEVFGLFIDACAELDDLDRCVRAIREHGGAHASYRALHSRAAVHFYHGRYELALRVCEVATLVYFNSGVFPYNAACCLARLGRHDEAFAALERALEAADGALTDMDSDPDLESLRSDARWIGLSARATLPSMVPAEAAAQAV